VNAGEWYHIAMVIDRSAQQIIGYLNGTNVGWTAGGFGPPDDFIPLGTLIDTSQLMYMGRRYDSGLPFSGLIDDLAIWDRALNPNQIAVLYRMGLDGNSFENMPEPTTMTLLAFGGMGLLARRRRRGQGRSAPSS
jgi:hypothetical protein